MEATTTCSRGTIRKTIRHEEEVGDGNQNEKKIGLI